MANIPANDSKYLVQLSATGKDELIIDPTLAKDILNGYGMSVLIRKYKTEFEEIKKRIAAKAIKCIQGTGTLTLQTGATLCRVSLWNEPVILPENSKRLMEILGERFDDLVFTRTSFKPTKKLLLLAESDEGIAELITIKKRPPWVRFERL